MDEQHYRLIFQAIDECISATDFEAFQDAVENDPDFRRRYLRAIELTETLAESSTRSKKLPVENKTPERFKKMPPPSQLICTVRIFVNDRGLSHSATGPSLWHVRFLSWPRAFGLGFNIGLLRVRPKRVGAKTRRGLGCRTRQPSTIGRFGLAVG